MSIFRRLVPLALLAGCLSMLFAQMTATIGGTVTDPADNIIPGATVVVENELTGFRATTSTDEDGNFRVTNIPYHSYIITVTSQGFTPFRTQVSLRSNVRLDLEVALQLGSVSDSVTVSDRSMLVDPEETGTHVQMNQSEIENLPLQTANRGLEAVVATFPGFAVNANGAIHARGAHNQMTFVIDGMPISDQLTGAFANAVDPNIVQTVELFTGNIPAEYGNKASAVANITTKSGLGSNRKFTGSTMVSVAQFDTLSQITSFSGESGKLGYSAIVNTMKTNRYLDQVSLDNLHNGGNNQRGFLRVDYSPTERDVLRFNAMAGRSSFQLANLRSQHANLQNQRQFLGDASTSVGWVRTIDANTTFDTTTSYRTTQAQLFTSPGDTPVTASQARHLSTFNHSSRINMIRGRHNLRMGGDVQRFPVSEFFTLGITSPDFNDPDSEGFNPNLLPHDLTRGGSIFQFADKGTGGFYTGFFQDNVRLGDFQISLGLRYDSYRFIVNGQQLQPRLGVSYHLKATNTVLRASYNRLYHTPPNENLLLTTSPQAAALSQPIVSETLGRSFVPIRPERTDFFELGLQQGIGSRISVSGAYYHKRASDLQDNDNFLDTGIIFPITLQGIRVNGVEGRLNVAPVGGFSGTLSLTHSKSVVTPPFTGGLFIGDDAIAALSEGPFIIDHDQPFSMHGILNWTGRQGLFSTLSVRHDYGLVTNPSDPAEVAQDPDFFDLLPYVRLNQDVPRVNPRTLTDITFGYRKFRNERRLWEASIQASNLANVTALYNFQSPFVGTRVVQPRTVGVRLRLFF
jgi:hypothetical protein